MADCNQVNWLLEIIKIVPTFIVGLIAVRIAWKQGDIAQEQRNIAEAKLNLDLFTRRLAIFTETWEAASNVVQTNDPMPPPPSMTNLLPEASFLLGAEIEAYMKELADKMIALAAIRRAKGNNNPDSPNKINEIDLERWIINAAKEGIRNIFSPYLNFSKWR